MFCFIQILFKMIRLIRRFSTKKLKDLTHNGPAIISCKNSELNHYTRAKYGKFEEIPLASKGWNHRKSRGDFFVLHPFFEGEKTNIEKESQESSFQSLGINERIINCLKNNDICSPTQIQQKAIPSILAGNNTLIAAETGCGKTLAFLLPLAQQIIDWKALQKDTAFNTPLGLIILPSRELASQIGEIALKLSEELSFTTKVIIGGKTKQKLLNPKFESIDLLISSFGALSKLVTNKIYRMNNVRHVVLDEADTLLDDSFNEQLSHFLKKLPFFKSSHSFGCQLTLSSATLPQNLDELLSGIIAPESIHPVHTENLHKTQPHVPQKFMRMSQMAKPTELLRLVKFDYQKKYPVIIFSNKTETCDWVSMFLNENGLPCVNLNGDMPYVFRLNTFEKFQKGEVNIISCTDIGSRGLDTVRVKHVINYDFPLYSADYIHRCGRTGRTGSPEACHVTNFISKPREIELVQRIETSVRRKNTLPNVNGNITGIVKKRVIRNLNKEMIKLRI